MRFQQLKVMQAIVRCRTAALGGHVDMCPRCGKDWGLSFNSCRYRRPKCQAQARKRWIAARERELLATSYFHVVFSLPHELTDLIRQNEVELYNLLFRAVSETLTQVAANPKHLGAEARRSASSAFCIPGGKTCCFIPTFIALFPPVGSRPAARAG